MLRGEHGFLRRVRSCAAVPVAREQRGRGRPRDGVSQRLPGAQQPWQLSPPPAAAAASDAVGGARGGAAAAAPTAARVPCACSCGGGEHTLWRPRGVLPGGRSGWRRDRRRPWRRSSGGWRHHRRRPWRRSSGSADGRALAVRACSGSGACSGGRAEGTVHRRWGWHAWLGERARRRPRCRLAADADQQRAEGSAPSARRSRRRGARASRSRSAVGHRPGRSALPRPVSEGPSHGIGDGGGGHCWPCGGDLGDCYWWGWLASCGQFGGCSHSSLLSSWWCRNCGGAGRAHPVSSEPWWRAGARPSHCRGVDARGAPGGLAAAKAVAKPCDN